ISDKIDPIEKVFFVQWFRMLAMSLSTTSWAITIIILLFAMATLFTLFATARQRKQKQLGFVGGVTLLLMTIAVILLTNTSHELRFKPEAIVFAPSVNVKSEPSLDATDQFVIHAGLKVEILDEDGQWKRIKLSDGNSGWLN